MDHFINALQGAFSHTQLAVRGLWLLELQATSTADDAGGGLWGMRVSGERSDMLGLTEWEYHVLGLGEGGRCGEQIQFSSR
jgi:hypothetical protein